MDPDRLEDAERAPLRHFAADGIPELVAGGLVLLWGLLLVAEQVWPGRLSNIVAVAGPLFAALVLLVPNPIMRRLKERITYPRIGYVKPHPAPPSRRGWAIGMAILVAGALLIGVQGGDATFQPLLPLIAAVLCAVVLVSEGLRVGVRRFLLYAGMALGTGAVTAWLCPPGLGLAFVMCVVGGALVVGGGWTLLQLLRLSAEGAA